MNANLHLLLEVEMNILKVQNDILTDMMAEETEKERIAEKEKNSKRMLDKAMGFQEGYIRRIQFFFQRVTS